MQQGDSANIMINFIESQCDLAPGLADILGSARHTTPLLALIAGQAAGNVKCLQRKILNCSNPLNPGVW